MSTNQMDKAKLERCVGEVTKRATELCDDPSEVLTVLMHVMASALWYIVSRMKKEDAERYVVTYLTRITGLIDVNIKARDQQG